jgi:hypothetical protein
VDNKITIGKYTLSKVKFPNGSYRLMIFTKDHEGGEFCMEDFEELLDGFYEENF